MLPVRSQKLANSVSKSLFQAPTRASSSVPLTESIDSNALKRPPRPASGEVKVSKLSNGVRVASVDNGGAVTRLAIGLQYGSRYESAANLGISQLAKNVAFATNNEQTSLRTVREIQSTGGSLSSSCTRESIIRNASFLRPKLADVMKNVAPGLTSPAFQRWDVKEGKAMCHLENATHASNHVAVNLELLHKAAFRNGVGNSLYGSEEALNNFSPQDLADFAANTFNGEQLVIGGTDVSHDELMRYAQENFGDLTPGAPVAPPQQKYYGGEVQVNTKLGFTYASLATQGAGLFSGDLPAILVLQKMLGGGPYVKWGSNTVSSRLNKAASAVTDSPYLIDSLNVAYSDCGLFGFTAIAPAQQITRVLQSAIAQVGEVAKGEINQADLDRAKNQAKSTLLMYSEQQEEVLDDVLKQVMLSGSYTAPKQFGAKIDAVTLGGVVNAAKKVFGGKPSLAVSGDTTSAPYLDELF